MPSKLDKLQLPLIYLITAGETSVHTRPASEEFQKIVRLVKAAISAGVDLIQIREKRLLTGVLYELCERIVGLRNRQTKILVNDRADVAIAAGADGVHLTSSSLPPGIIRETFGGEILIGVSTHTEEEVIAAREQGADFVVFGPVFETRSKVRYGEPQGLSRLSSVVSRVSSFPVLALGGVNVDNAHDCLRAGAAGVAAIGMFQDPEKLLRVVAEIRALT